MGFLIYIVMMLAVITGFHYSIDLIVNTFPSTYHLFLHNGIAIGIFALSLITGIPFILGTILALIIGAFSSGDWYAIAVQYLALELVWFLLSALFTAVVGGTAVISGSLYEIYKNKFSNTASSDIGDANYATVPNTKTTHAFPLFKFLKNLMNFHGRYGRMKYFTKSLVLIVFYIILIFTSLFLRSALHENLFMPIFCVIIIPAFFIMLICGIKNTVLRCHDLNYPTAAGIVICILLMAVNTSQNLFAAILSFLVSLYLLLKKGTDGDNQYGPDPLRSE